MTDEQPFDTLVDQYGHARAELVELANGLRARLVDGPEPTLAELALTTTTVLGKYSNITPRRTVGILTDLANALTAVDNLTASVTSRIVDLCSDDTTTTPGKDHS